MPRTSRTTLTAVAAALGAATMFAAVPASATAPAPLDSYVISTEPGTLPEGIDITPSGKIYVGTLFGGVKQGQVGIPTLTDLTTDGVRRLTMGTHVDTRGRVWVAAWDHVEVFAPDGTSLAQFPLPDSDAAANDLVITQHAVFVTDMNDGHIYRIPLEGNGFGEIELFLDARDLGLDPATVGWNGIDATSNGKTLVVSALGLGQLYRVDVATARATQIDLGGRWFGADGIELRGTSLYAVLNELAPADRGVYVVELDKDLASGTVVTSTTGDMFQYPTTLAVHKGSVYVVNGQFDVWPGIPPYTITVIPDPCGATSAC